LARLKRTLQTADTTVTRIRTATKIRAVIRDRTAIKTVKITDLAVIIATTATEASLGVITYMLRITGI
jgi:hypothetical protein